MLEFTKTFINRRPLLVGVCVISSLFFAVVLFRHNHSLTDELVVCATNKDCAAERTCLNRKCEDACRICGEHTSCHVNNHVPYCTCVHGFEGNPLTGCSPSQDTRVAVLQCTTDDQCSQDLACTEQRCQDPCPKVCGVNSVCNVTYHRPVCACSIGYTGDPFTRCIKTQEDPQQNNTMECASNDDCSLERTCLYGKCEDACRICGTNTSCHVNNHVPYCTCVHGFEGNPLTGCSPSHNTMECASSDDCSSERRCLYGKCEDACRICGANTSCHVSNHLPYCTCVHGFKGNPFTGCFPSQNTMECASNHDCSSERMCLYGKCEDACRICGANTSCHVSNHVPYCTCIHGFEGNPVTGCSPGLSGLTSEKKDKVYHVYVDEKLTWDMAMSKCRSLGQRLATIDNQQQYNQLLQLIHEMKVSEQFWTSGNDIKETGNYVWGSTGEPMNFTKWSEHEPNHMVFYGVSEHCVELSGTVDYKMKDQTCNWPIHYICETY